MYARIPRWASFIRQEAAGSTALRTRTKTSLQVSGDRISFRFVKSNARIEAKPVLPSPASTTVRGFVVDVCGMSRPSACFLSKTAFASPETYAPRLEGERVTAYCARYPSETSFSVSIVPSL